MKRIIRERRLHGNARGPGVDQSCVNWSMSGEKYPRTWSG